MTDEQSTTTGATKPPFFSFSFTMTDKAIGRRVLRMVYLPPTDDYELTVEAGPAADPQEKFTRRMSRTRAESLRDTLRDIDAFNWDAEYGDTTAPGTRRWNVNIVFEENVYSVQSLGGSDVPTGFDTLLEALYQLDMPRPHTTGNPYAAGTGTSMGATGIPGMPGMPDMSALFGSLDAAGAPDAHALQEMQQAWAQMQQNPAAFTQQMREEFRRLPADQQNMLIDMMASSGMGTREWWEQFFRGL